MKTLRLFGARVGGFPFTVLCVVFMLLTVAMEEAEGAVSRAFGQRSWLEGLDE